MSQNAIVSSSSAHKLVYIIGEGAYDTVNELEASRLSVKLLKFIASCANVEQVLYRMRFRMVSAEQRDPSTSSLIASAGFYPVKDALNGPLFACVSCGAARPLNNLGDKEFQQLHLEHCAYRRLQLLAVGELQEPETDDLHRLQQYLTQELTSTRVQVAVEFGYSEDMIITILGARFLGGFDRFQSAGELVNALSNLEETCLLNDVEVKLLCSGIATEIIAGQERVEATPPMPPETSGNGFESLRAETITLLLQTYCKKCLKNHAEYVLLPCSHLSLCGSCVAISHHCPVCRMRISETIRTYIP